MSLTLSHAELVEITGKEQPAAQCRMLRAMGWQFEQRGSFPLVSRNYAERKLAGEAPRAPKGINWEAVT